MSTTLQKPQNIQTGWTNLSTERDIRYSAENEDLFYSLNATFIRDMEEARAQDLGGETRTLEEFKRELGF